MKTSATAAQGEVTAEGGTSSVSPWWLVAFVVAVAAVVAAVVTGRRKHRWEEQLHAAESEVHWFASTLLPDLRAADSLDRAIGGWHVSSARVHAAEDRLTVLEASARNDPGRLRARTLRDAVRLARGRLESLEGPGVHESWRPDLQAAIAELDAALGTATQPR